MIIKNINSIFKIEKNKLLVVGTFRSGTNAIKYCLEKHYHVEVTFNEWFWKHGVPPTGIQCSIPKHVPILIMSKSPSAFVELLYPMFLHRRTELQSGKSISDFIRRECIVYDNTGNNVRPKYWFRNPVEYWNHFYYAWLNWTAVQSRCYFLKYESLAGSTHEEVNNIAHTFRLKIKNNKQICLPSNRVGPHIPTKREGDQFKITFDDLVYIRQHTNHDVARKLGYHEF